MKEKGTCGSHLKNKIKTKTKTKQTKVGVIEREKDFFIFFFFSRFSIRYMEIGPSKFVGAITKVLYSTRATHGNQKHGISPSLIENMR